MAMYMATIAIMCHVEPDLLSDVPKASWAARKEAIRDVRAPVLLLMLVVGGL